MSCDPLVFTQVDAAKFACVAEKVAATVGIPIAGPAGTQSKDGITVAWTFDEAAGSLTIQCLDSPWNKPCIFVNAKIKELVGACGVA
jgi:hypothetical protein